MGVLDKIKEKKDKIKKIQNAESIKKKLELAEVEKKEVEKIETDLLTFEVEALILRYYPDIIPDNDYMFFIPILPDFTNLFYNKNYLVCAQTTGELIDKINSLIKKEEGKRYFVLNIDLYKSKIVTERIRKLWNNGKIGIFLKNAEVKTIKEILDGNYELLSADKIYDDDDLYYDLNFEEPKYKNHFKIPVTKIPNFAKIISIK